MTIAWTVALVAFLILEAATAGLTCIWFALGALGALLAAIFGAPLWLQIAWFAVISVATLLLTRPLVRKYVNQRSQPTNADRCLGQSAVVTEKIDNLAGTGAVFLDGKTWSARTVTGETAEKDTLVTVERIEGVKLLVSLPERCSGKE